MLVRGLLLHGRLLLWLQRRAVRSLLQGGVPSCIPPREGKLPQGSLPPATSPSSDDRLLGAPTCPTSAATICEALHGRGETFSDSDEPSFLRRFHVNMLAGRWPVCRVQER
jgi:hypothetical protein